MTSNYYYLIAGLPELLLDTGKQQLACVDFLSEATEQLRSDDLHLLQCLQLPYDNKNLLALLQKTDAPFDKNGSISEEDFAVAIKFPDDLPEYMQQFIEDFHENRSPAAGITPADHLAWFFYEAMTGHANEFIREWYTFDLHLRNVIAGINCRKEFEHLEALATDREKAVASVVVGRDEVAEAILRSNAPDFGLVTTLPWVEKLVALSRGSVEEFEKGIDDLRWEMLDEMTILSHFRAETVFAFFIKLTIVERWLALDPVSGKERLERLLDELTASYSVPAEF